MLAGINSITDLLGFNFGNSILIGGFTIGGSLSVRYFNSFDVFVINKAVIENKVAITKMDE